MWIALFVVLMDIVGVGIIAPMFPFYAMRLGAGPAAVTLCMGLYTAALFFSAPILGRLSDRYGRKPVMIFSLLGSVASYLILMWASSLWSIVLSRLIGGMAAGNISAAQAYITDRTEGSDRMKFLGLIGAAVGLGFVFGPVLGSWLGGDSFENANFMAPALVAASLCGVAVFFVLFFLDESLPNRSETSHTSGNKTVNAFAIHKILAAHIKDPSRRNVFYIAVLCSACYQIGAAFYEDIFPIWAADFSIISGTRGMLPMFLASGLMYVLAQAFLVKRIRNHRSVLLLSGATFGIATYLMTLAADHASPVAVTVLMGLIAGCAAMIFTSAQTIISYCADAASRGFVLGIASSIGMLGKTIAISVSGLLYANVSHHSPYYAATICGVALVLIASNLSRAKLNDTVNVNPPASSGLLD